MSKLFYFNIIISSPALALLPSASKRDVESWIFNMTPWAKQTSSIRRLLFWSKLTLPIKFGFILDNWLYQIDTDTFLRHDTITKNACENYLQSRNISFLVLHWTKCVDMRTRKKRNVDEPSAMASGPKHGAGQRTQRTCSGIPESDWKYYWRSHK